MSTKQTENKQQTHINKILDDLKTESYKGRITPMNPKQKVNDEDLITIFSAIKDKWYNVSKLQKILDDQITINTSNPKRSPIGSNYLRRLSRLTGKKWKQKRAFDENGEFIIKVYTVK